MLEENSERSMQNAIMSTLEVVLQRRFDQLDIVHRLCYEAPKRRCFKLHACANYLRFREVRGGHERIL